MRKLLVSFPFILFLYVGNVLGQQKNSVVSTAQDIKYSLAASLQTNPNNPLNFNKDFLINLASKLPDGTIKSRLLSYSTNFGADADLSFRQIYSDVEEAFKINPSLSISQAFSKTAQSLDMLLNKSGTIIDIMKGNFENIDATTFYSDPEFMDALSKVTGSPILADNIARGAGVAIDVLKALKEEKDRVKLFKENYKKFSEMSALMVYPEIDKALSAALIDAYVGKIANPLNSLYRYDFSSGTSLVVEGGILKLIDPVKHTVKNLAVAEQRNNGLLDFKYNSNRIYRPTILSVSGSSIFITTYNNFGKECAGCLEDGKFSVVDVGALKTPELPVGAKTKPIEYNQNNDEPSYDLKKRIKFLIKGKEVKWDSEDYYYPLSWPSNFNVTLLTKSVLDATTNSYHHSTLLQVEHKATKKTNSKYFRNEIAAITNVENILYVFGANGSYGSVDLDEISDPDEVCARIDLLLKGAPVIPAYTFVDTAEGKLFEGLSEYRVEALSPKFVLPQIIPTNAIDNTSLVYLQGRNMVIIDRYQPEKKRFFKLSFAPTQGFFARENGSYTLHLLGFNEFSLPIAKKYSLNKLLNPAQQEGKQPTKQPVVKNENNVTNTASLADEIKKLRLLLDDGSITKDEYEKAKKKLLEKN